MHIIHGNIYVLFPSVININNLHTLSQFLTNAIKSSFCNVLYHTCGYFDGYIFLLIFLRHSYVMARHSSSRAWVHTDTESIYVILLSVSEMAWRRHFLLWTERGQYLTGVAQVPTCSYVIDVSIFIFVNILYASWLISSYDATLRL